MKNLLRLTQLVSTILTDKYIHDNNHRIQEELEEFLETL